MLRSSAAMTLNPFIILSGRFNRLFHSQQQKDWETTSEKIIYTKIQGAATEVVRSLRLNPSWILVKAELIKVYIPRETYHQLYHEAFNLKNSNVRNYYHCLLNILNRLNLKYELDESKPIEFKPDTNEN